jgi:hypothetical protein
MRENARHMAELRQRQEQLQRNASAPDVIEAYGKTMDAHAQAVHDFAGAFRTLYDGMSDPQKRKADDVFRRRVREAAERQKSS